MRSWDDDYGRNGARDVLFDDPLNVRGGSGGRSPQGDDRWAQAPTVNHQQHAAQQRLQAPDAIGEEKSTEQEEDPNYGPVGNFFWWVVAGGKQCCSMRDRNRPADVAAAKRAAEMGRPPASDRFPEPETPERRGLDAFRTSGDDAIPVSQEARGPDLSAMLFSTHNNEESMPPLGRDRDDRERDRAAASSAAQRDRAEAGRRNRSPSPSESSEDAPSMPPLPPAGRAPPQERPPASPQPPQRSVSPPKLAAPLPTPAQMPSALGPPQRGGAVAKRWEWPPWCLNFKSPCIEVWVLDEDTEKGRWVEAEPQSRVVDKNNRDAYLCAEYNWDGEYYVQDFGPQHVRRRGHKETVLEMFERAHSGGDDLEQTMLAPGRKRNDQGGGVAHLLED